jgi:hypothetical protein
VYLRSRRVQIFAVALVIAFVVPLVFIAGLASVPLVFRMLRSKDRFTWKPPLYVAAGVSILLLSLVVFSADGDVLYIFLIAPVICLSCLVLLVAAAVRKRPRQCLSMLLTVVVFLGASWVLLKNERALRTPLRWILWSHRYKARVLAQAAPAKGEFKHVEWDGWGGTPVGDWTAYVVFDPTDSFLAAAKSRLPGKFSGIPCNVDRVRRLESQWYSVELSMNEWWERCD